MRAEIDVSSETQADALEAVAYERAMQDAKWGFQDHQLEKWISILGEEFGELCQAVNETVFDNGDNAKRCKGGYANVVLEATQVAAVAVEIIEYMFRHKEDFI